MKAVSSQKLHKDLNNEVTSSVEGLENSHDSTNPSSDKNKNTQKLFLINAFVAHLLCLEKAENEYILCLNSEYEVIKFFVEILEDTFGKSNDLDILRGYLGRASSNVINFLKKFYRGSKIALFFQKHKEFIVNGTRIALSVSYKVHLEEKRKIHKDFIEENKVYDVPDLYNFHLHDMFVNIFGCLEKVCRSVQKRPGIKFTRLSNCAFTSFSSSQQNFIHSLDGSAVNDKLYTLLQYFNIFGFTDTSIEFNPDLDIPLLIDFISKFCKKLDAVSESDKSQLPCFDYLSEFLVFDNSNNIMLNFDDIGHSVVESIKNVLSGSVYLKYSDLPKSIDYNILPNLVLRHKDSQSLIQFLEKSSLFLLKCGQVCTKETGLKIVEFNKTSTPQVRKFSSFESLDTKENDFNNSVLKTSSNDETVQNYATEKDGQFDKKCKLSQEPTFKVNKNLENQCLSSVTSNILTESTNRGIEKTCIPIYCVNESVRKVNKSETEIAFKNDEPLKKNDFVNSISGVGSDKVICQESNIEMLKLSLSAVSLVENTELMPSGLNSSKKSNSGVISFPKKNVSGNLIADNVGMSKFNLNGDVNNDTNIIDGNNECKKIYMPNKFKSELSYSEVQKTLGNDSLVESVNSSLTPDSICIEENSAATDECKITNGFHVPNHEVSATLQCLSSKVILLTLDSCIVETEGLNKYIFCLKPSFHCVEHVDCSECFDSLVIGDDVLCYIPSIESTQSGNMCFAFTFSKDSKSKNKTEADNGRDPASNKVGYTQSTTEQPGHKNSESVINKCTVQKNLSSDGNLSFREMAIDSSKTSQQSTIDKSVQTECHELENQCLVSYPTISQHSQTDNKNDEKQCQTTLSGEVRCCPAVKEQACLTECNKSSQGVQTDWESSTIEIQTNISGSIISFVDSTSSECQTLLSGPVKQSSSFSDKCIQASEVVDIYPPLSDTHAQRYFHVLGEKRSSDRSCQTFSTGPIMIKKIHHA